MRLSRSHGNRRCVRLAVLATGASDGDFSNGRAQPRWNVSGMWSASSQMTELRIQTFTTIEEMYQHQWAAFVPSGHAHDGLARGR